MYMPHFKCCIWSVQCVGQQVASVCYTHIALCCGFVAAVLFTVSHFDKRVTNV